MKRRTFLKITLPLTIAGKTSASTTTKPDLKFGLVADPQYADVEPGATRFFRNSLAKLEATVAELNQHPIAFTVTLGDLIDRDFTSFAAIMPIYAKLKAPHFPICGNHDFDVADADKSKVLNAMGLEKPYYSINRESWRFLFLDGTDIGIWRQPARRRKTRVAREMLKKLAAANLPQAYEWNSAIGPRQMEWIANELDAAKTNNQSVIIFNHYPIIPANHTHNLWNSAELLTLLDQHNHIAAYMNGHNHAGNYGEHYDTHYLTVKGMVETENETAYAIVSCFPDRLEIEGYGLEPTRNLALIASQTESAP